MKDILELVIKNLVEDKENISINEVQNEKGIVFEVKVSENDMGKVIGKQGRLAKAIRTVIKAIAGKEGKKISIEFIG